MQDVNINDECGILKTGLEMCRVERMRPRAANDIATGRKALGRLSIAETFIRQPPEWVAKQRLTKGHTDGQALLAIRRASPLI
jgi:hypothetical protein